MVSIFSLMFLISGICPITYANAQEIDSTKVIIYRDAYETALSDGELTPEEQSLLNSLQKSLLLSEEQINEAKLSVRLKLPKMLDQSGRWPLVAQNMIYGVGLYGWGIPFVLDADNPKWVVAGEMLSLGSAFWLTYQYTKKMEIPHARAQMMRYGSVVGISTAATISSFILDQSPTDTVSKLSVGIFMVSIPAGIYIGDLYYKKWQPSLGQSWALAQWGEIGASSFKSIHRMLIKEPQSPEWQWAEDQQEYDRKSAKYESEHDQWLKGSLLFYTIGFPIGSLSERYFYRDRQYTFGDGLMLTWGRATGLVYGFLIWDFIRNKDSQNHESIQYLFQSVGSIAGTVAMDRFIKGKEYTTGQSILMALGSISGGCFACGIPVIAEVSESRVYDVVVIAGSLCGLYLTDRVLNVKSKTNVGLSEKVSLSVFPTLIPVKRTVQPGLNLSVRF